MAECLVEGSPQGPSRYSCAGCVLHKAAIPKRGTVYLTNIIGVFIFYDTFLAGGSKVSCSCKLKIIHTAF